MNKPELSVTIKFRGVTIEGMTVEELRELRDLLNQIDPIVEEKTRVIERVREYVPYYPPRPIWIYEEKPYIGPYWTTTTSGTAIIGNDVDGPIRNTLTISCTS